jgi:hypothetical protein
MEITHSIVIESNVESLWKWLGNPENAKVWMESVSKTKYIHKTPNMIGTTFRETVVDEGGELELEGVVKDYHENERIAFHLKSRIHEVDVEYSITDIGDAVRLDVSTDIRWKFPMNILSVFTGSKIKQQIVESSSREFQKLRELCEAEN